jgi:hypothetical protein
MSDTNQNAAQKAFEFADKLNMFFPKGIRHSSGSPDLKRGTYNVNATLLDCLGKERYRELCHSMRKVYFKKKELFTADPFFKEGFAENPVANENILFDNEVQLYWKLSEIIAEVKKLL